MVAVINVDAYPFLAYSDLTCHLDDTGISVSGCIMTPDSKETELGNSDQKASPSADKDTGVVLVPCSVWKCVPTANSSGVDISEVPGCQLLQK